MKVTIGRRPPETVPYRKFQWTGSGGTAIKHVATVLLFALFGSWVGGMMVIVYGDLPTSVGDVLAVVGFAAMGTGMCLWLILPWTIFWCLVYWCWIGGRTAGRLLVCCVGWGVGQGLIFALRDGMIIPDNFPFALRFFALIGTLAGLASWPVVWWMWREKGAG